MSPVIVREATLLYVVRAERLLLMRKRRGHGAGLINAPGGKVEINESPAQCARREFAEEAGVFVDGAEVTGELVFAESDGSYLLGDVFRADVQVSLDVVSTAEGDPLWYDVANLPWNEMWPQDQLWLPQLIAALPFSARFRMAGGRALEQQLTLLDTQRWAELRVRAHEPDARRRRQLIRQQHL